MPKKTGTKNKAKSTPKTKVINRNKNTNINNVHVHVEKPKTRKRRTTKPKAEPNNNPLSSSIGLSRGASQNLGFHPRGLINNENKILAGEKVDWPDQPDFIDLNIIY